MATPAASFNQVATDQLRDTKRVIERLQNFRVPYDAQRDEMYRHFVGKGRQQMFPDGKTKRSNIFVPYAYANVEQVRSEVHDIFWGVDPPFTTLPKGQKDEDAALRMQPVMELKCLKEGKLATVSDEFIGGLCIYGFQALDVGWNWDYYTTMEYQVVPVMDPFSGQPMPHPFNPNMPAMQRKLVPVKKPCAHPKYECIDIYDLLVDPDGAFVARLWTKTLPQFLREAEMNPSLYDPSALMQLQSKLGSDRDAQSALIQCATLWDAINGTYTMICMDEDTNARNYKDSRYANRSANYSQYRRAIAKIGEPLLLGGGQNPYYHYRLPILYTSFTKMPGELFGMGMIEASYSLNEGLNRFVNMITDKWDLGINGRIMVDMTGDIDFLAMQRANVPGGVIGVYGNPNDKVAQFPMPKPDAGDYNILPLYKNMIEVVSSTSDFYDRGVGEGNGNDTATGVTAVIRQSNKRTGRLVLRLETEVFGPALEMSASNIQQFLTDDIEVKITDEMRPWIPKINSQFLQISPADLAGQYDFKFVGAAYKENPFITQKNALSLVNMIATNPQLAAFAKPYQGLRELFRIFRIPNPNQFIKTPEEVMADQQAALMRQMQMHSLTQAGLLPQPGGPGQGKGGGGDKPSQNFAGGMPAPISGEARSLAQGMGGNAMNGMGQDEPSYVAGTT